MYRLILILFLGFSIKGNAQECKRPFGILFPSKGVDSVEVKWLDSNGSNILGYQLAYGFAGGGIGNATLTDTFTTKSAILKDLIPSTQYEVFVRTICDTLKASVWNGPFGFNTHLTNPTECGIGIALRDESCTIGGETYIIEVKETGILGSTVFLESVDLILEHPWLADLEIILENPAGEQSVLSQHNGAAQDNFGIFSDSCDLVTRFSSNACISIQEGQAPFNGVYSPITSLVNLNDGTSSSGNWKLHICDNSSGDKGLLKYFNLNLTPQLCEPIVDFFVSDINGDNIQLNWTPPFNCESIEIEYGPEGFSPGTGEGILKQLNCKRGETILTNLDPLTNYDFYLLGDCITSTAAPSCKSSFTTSCTNKSFETTFDENNLCQNTCILPCEIEGEWFNGDEDLNDWILWNSPTETPNTGPESDLNRRGNYIYVDSSPELCGTELSAHLNSSCIDIGDNPECGLSFWYHMEGKDQGNLILLASLNDFQTNDTLFVGSESTGWEQRIIDLNPYQNQFIKLRFVAITAQGVEGDIGLDQIELFGTASFGMRTYFLDEDNDGYGILDSTISVCGELPDGYAPIAGDCDDSNPLINPGVSEIGCNGIDENCNGLEDDNLEPPNISVDLISNETCAGLSDGQITLNVEGVNGPYQLEWNDGHSGMEIEDLKAGFYRATVTDASGCATLTEFIEVQAESKMEIEILNIVDATCSGRRDGSLVIQPTGGVTPYTYEWNIDQIQATIIGLVEGSYICTVTDAEGCTKVTDSIHIGVSKPLNIGTIIHQNISCKGADDGRIVVNTSNGVPPYEYQWDHGPTTSEINNLSPGIYTVHVEDDFKCVSDFTVEVTEPDSLEQLLLSFEQIKCHGDANGVIKTTTIGGTPPFTYQWNSGHITDDISSLESGAYILEVTDINGCNSKLDTVFISEPEPLELFIDSIGTASCRMRNDGSIKLSVEGGLEPYSYFWRRTEADSLVIPAILPGNYGFTAVDRNDCKTSIPAIDVPFNNQSTSVELSVKEPYVCPEEKTGIIKAEIGNGAFPITYNWSNGKLLDSPSLQDSIENLGSGVYSLTVTDAEGCVSVSNIITFNSIPLFSHEVSTFIPNPCKEDSLGIIGIEVEGGTGQLSYFWSNEKTTPAIGKLPNGDYSLTVTDANNCQYYVIGLEMFSESNLEVEIQITDASPGLNDGAITINPIDGISPFSIDWGVDTLTGFNLNQLYPGTYHASISDDKNCVLDTSIVVDQASSTKDINVEKYTVFPNPTTGLISIKGGADNLHYLIMNGLGQKIKNGQTVDGKIDLSSQPSGIYYLILNNQGPNKSFKIFKR